MSKKISIKQRKFANEYLKTNNAYESAIVAGYSKSYAKNATQKLLDNGGIQKYIHQKTDKIVEKESNDVDDVLTNIYRIAAGKAVKNDYKNVDNINKKLAEKEFGRNNLNNPEVREKYEENHTTYKVASTKDQVAAAELWLKYRGLLKGDSKELQDVKIRKLNAEAGIQEARLNEIKENNNDQMDVLTGLLQKISNDIVEDEHNDS